MAVEYVFFGEEWLLLCFTWLDCALGLLWNEIEFIESCWNTRKNLTTSSKSVNNPLTSGVRKACPNVPFNFRAGLRAGYLFQVVNKFETSCEQLVTNLLILRTNVASIGNKSKRKHRNHTNSVYNVSGSERSCVSYNVWVLSGLL